MYPNMYISYIYIYIYLFYPHFPHGFFSPKFPWLQKCKPTFATWRVRVSRTWPTGLEGYLLPERNEMLPEKGGPILKRKESEIPTALGFLLRKPMVVFRECKSLGKGSQSFFFWGGELNDVVGFFSLVFLHPEWFWGLKDVFLLVTEMMQKSSKHDLPCLPNCKEYVLSCSISWEETIKLDILQWVRDGSVITRSMLRAFYISYIGNPVCKYRHIYFFHIYTYALKSWDGAWKWTFKERDDEANLQK